MANVYLDFESMEVLNKVRKENPNFSLAGFVQEAIKNLVGQATDDLPELYKKMGEFKTKIDYYNNEIVYLENKIETVKKRQEDEEEQKKREEEEKIEKEKIEKFFQELTTEGWDIYKKGVKEGKWHSTKDYYREYEKGDNGDAAD